MSQRINTSTVRLAVKAMRMNSGLALLVAVWMWMAVPAKSQSLSDFQDAVKQEGCKAIPYPTERGQCITRQDNVERHCEEDERSCSKVDPEGLLRNRQGIQNSLPGLSSQIAELKNKSAELKKKSDDEDDSGKRSAIDSERSAIDRELADRNAELSRRERELADIESKLARNTEEINVRLQRNEQCLSFREEVQRAFRETLQRLNGENDPAIKPLAEELIRRFTAEIPRHDNEARRVEVDLRTCREMLGKR